MKVSTEIDNNFGYEKITQLVDNIPLKTGEGIPSVLLLFVTKCIILYTKFNIMYHVLNTKTFSVSLLRPPSWY